MEPMIIDFYTSKLPEVMPAWASIKEVQHDGTYLIRANVTHIDFMIAIEKAVIGKVPPDQFYAQFGFEFKQESVGFWSTKIPSVLPRWASVQKIGSKYLVSVDARSPDFIAAFEEISIKNDGLTVGCFFEHYGFDMIEDDEIVRHAES